MMARIAIVLFAVAFLAYAWLSPAPDRPGGEAYQALFNGVSLHGWHQVGGGASYRVENGAIVGVHGPGDNSFLRTDRTFRDFELLLEVRWGQPGNSGIMFRAAQRPDGGRVFGYQYELDPSERAWSGGIYDESRRGWLYNPQDDDAARAALDADGWNQVRIEAQGPFIRTWLNDVPVSDIVDIFDSEGFIALQVHAGDTGIMRWRNIRLRELESVGAQGAVLDERRQLADFAVDFDMAACAEPGRVQVRHAKGMGGTFHFAELTVSENQASAAMHRGTAATHTETVALQAADHHRVRIIAHGQKVVLSVDEHDLLRTEDPDLLPRGKLVVEPADCGGEFDIAGLPWTDLTARDAKPQFYETLDTAPAPVYTPQEALSTFRLAPGFELELVAAEPLIGDPVAAAWDEYGRLYVVEMRSYMPDAYGTGRGTALGRVVRLEDTDNDGRMDRSEVFLDGLTYPRAVAVTNDGVLVGEPPHLWLCELSDPAASCDNRRSLGDYGKVQGDGNVEHLENKLLPGLDNWYYNAKSARKLRLVDGELRSRESLFRGQWGIARDDWGRLFYNHNSNLVTADFFAAEDLFDARSTSTVPGLGEVLSAPEEIFSVRVNPGVNRAYVEGTLREDGRLRNATSASGLAAYRGGAMADLGGDLFVAEPAGNVVAQFKLRENGIDLTAEHALYDDPDWGQRDFLGSTDERFRPVDVMNGPDGGLYLVDMYRGLIQDEHYLTEQLREQVLQRHLDAPIGLGRIWRIRPQGAVLPRPQMPGTMTAREQVDALASDNGWIRDTAQRLLLQAGGDVTVPLESQVREGSELAASHALWTLHGRNELRRETVVQALQRGMPALQQQALRAGTGLLTEPDLAQVARAAQHPAVRMQTAFSLRRYASSSQVQQLLLDLLAGGPDDTYLRQAVVKAVAGAELDFMPRALAHDWLAAESESGTALLEALAESAYRSLRPDLSSSEPAPLELQQLLATIHSQGGDRGWAHLALLEGLRAPLRTTGFVPAQLPEAPPIFADTSIDESSPLWAARLGARHAFTWPGDELAAGITPLGPNQMALMRQGETFYASCGACHGQGGNGIAGLGPALAGSDWVLGPPEHLARIILQGMDTERNGVMPPHGHIAELDDEVLAGLMIYLRRSWGNTGDPVMPDQAAEIRQAAADRATPWSAEELAAVLFDRGYDKYVGKYKVAGFMTLTVSMEQGEVMLGAPMQGKNALTELDDGWFSAGSGAEQLRVQFQQADDGSVNAMLIHRGGQQVAAPRVQ